MLSKLTAFIRQQNMIAPGEHVICAVSGGADSVALLFALYLLKEKLDFRLSAAHFNHHLRGAESDRDEAFVRQFCDRYDIPLYAGSGQVTAGEKGLEAAAREARYAYLRTLPGKIATAHTAGDNAETVLLHLVRGTGLKGLCGITPVGDNLIRPMLTVTRTEVEAFLEEYCLAHAEDSSNAADDYLRNRLRHNVLPLLEEENPRLAENLSAMALLLRQDSDLLESSARQAYTLEVEALRQLAPALRSRVLEQFLKESGVREPERSHIDLAERLVFSDNPSAQAHFPGGVTIERRYDRLHALAPQACPEKTVLAVPGITDLPAWHLRVICRPAEAMVNAANVFTVAPCGPVCIRPRQPGDEMRLPGGTKSLKKIYIDRKIPASQRPLVPVLADEQGVLGVQGIGANGARVPNQLPAVQFIFEVI